MKRVLMNTIKSESQQAFNRVKGAKLKEFALVLVLFCLIAHCHGQGTTTIGFQGAAPGVQTMVGANPYTDPASGMQFGSLTPESLLLNGGGIAGYPDNGTCYLEVGGDMRFGPHTFPPTSPLIPFNLLSFDAAELISGPQTLTVVGYLPMAGTVTNYFTVSSQTFQTFHLDSSFTGVFQVDVLCPAWSLDDIVVSGIPEPSAGVLVLLGTLCGLGYARARRRPPMAAG
ncbi:MAG: hypothetical protein ABSD29_16275 [Verrucomicrobiota bacterium]